MTYEPLHHKYRPQTFAELVGQEAIAVTLTNALRQQKIAPAYLFTGARGTGKTSSARILAKSLNCLSSPVPTEQPCGECEVCHAIAKGSSLDVIEIDAASNTGVDNIRELIERAQFAPVQCRYKVYVVDECHMLSTAAFNALLKTLEEPPNQVVFVLATTDPQRVLPTIISRCQRFDFRRIPLEAMVQHLGQIAALETISISDEAITLVAQIAQGGLRDAESLLDQLSLSPETVTVDQVWDLVGSVPERDLLQLVQAIANDNPETVLDSTRRLMDRGREPLIVLQNLASFYRDLLIAKTAPTRNDLVTITPPTWEQLCDLAQSLDVGTILAGQQHLRSAEVQLKNTTQPRLWLEVTLMGLLPSAIAAPTIAASPTIAQPQSSSPNRSQIAPSSTSPAIAQPTHRVAESPPPSSPRVKEVEKQPALQPTNQTIADSTEDVRDRQPPATDAVTELDQIWQQIVSHLHPLSKALLNDYGRLLAFDSQTARIGISTENLLKIAQNQTKNIEKAFLDVFQQKVKISLEVSSMAGVKAAAIAPPSDRMPGDRVDNTNPQSPTSVDSTAAEIATPSNQPSTLPPTSSHSQFPAQYPSRSTPSHPPTTKPPQRNRQKPASSAESASTEKSPTAQPQPATEPTMKSWEEDEVTKAAKQLAEFFAGKVVSETDDLSPSSTITAELELTELEVDSDNALTPTWSPSPLEDDLADDDDDDDDPF